MMTSVIELAADKWQVIAKHEREQMDIKRNLVILFVGLINLAPLNLSAAEIFSDSFESAAMSSTNADGFAWGSNNKTSVVTVDKIDGPVAVYNNREIYNLPGLSSDGSIRNWQAKSGSYSLRFRYAAGQNWTEQRYDFGSGYPEIWVSYWIRVPSNYFRRDGRNNKWFNIQMAPMSEYENPAVSRIEMQDWPNGSGGFNINIQFRNGSDGKFVNSSRYDNFITPADAGRWMHLVYHLKASSTTTSTDGIIKMYRKWENESKYLLINSLSSINVGIGAGSIKSSRLGWAAGYIMGYANTTYKVDTEWLLDSFVISNTSLLIEPGTTPKAPTNLIIQ